MRTAFWSVFGVVIVAQVICVVIAATTDETVWVELVFSLIGFIVMLFIAIAHSFDGLPRLSTKIGLWLGLAGYFIWQLGIYPMAFILYLNIFHGERGWVWTDDFGGGIYLLDEHWETRGYDPQYGGQASAHPPWISK